jgi:hypothetical protein
VSFLLLLGQMGIFGVGIVVDQWRGYSLPALAESRRRVGRRSGVDLAGYTGPFSRSHRIHWPFLRISYTILERKKKKKKKKKKKEEVEEKRRSISVLLFFFFFFFKKKY